MHVILELSGHPKANVKSVVVSDTVVVGRSEACGLQIASPTVSRKHCEIRVTGNAVSVIDLGSSNGTFVDATRLPPGEETALAPGCRLNVGGVRFIVHFAVVPKESTGPPPLAAIPAGDDVLLIEAEKLEAPANLGESSAEADFATLESSAVGEAESTSADDSGLMAEPLAGVAAQAEIPDEPIIDEPLAELEADGPLAEDEPPLEAPLADKPIIETEESRESFEPMLEIDDEPDLDALFAESSGEIPIRDAVTAGPQAAEDEPILESEDEAFGFLMDDDDDEAGPKAASSGPEDSRLGDFLSQLGRD
jgi:pSer/pThr/pTyr-binding forkhead associated (FHA) protein